MKPAPWRLPVFVEPTPASVGQGSFEMAGRSQDWSLTFKIVLAVDHRLLLAGHLERADGRSTRQSAADCAILAALTSSAEPDGRMARTYVLVVICEIAVICGLWLLDRLYS